MNTVNDFKILINRQRRKPIPDYCIGQRKHWVHAFILSMKASKQMQLQHQLWVMVMGYGYGV
jgi:hypothetical protein